MGPRRRPRGSAAWHRAGAGTARSHERRARSGGEGCSPPTPAPSRLPACLEKGEGLQAPCPNPKADGFALEGGTEP